jgi:hypothetical protein
MFFAGIITSALPYILLAGLFGTLVVNQVTGAGQEEADLQASEKSSHRQVYSNHPGDAELSDATYLVLQQKIAPDQEKKTQPPGITWQQPLMTPGSCLMRFFLCHVQPYGLHNPNASYTLRGPPATA